MLFSGAASVDRASITRKYCAASDDRRERERVRGRPAHSVLMFLNRLELFGKFGLPTSSA